MRLPSGLPRRRLTSRAVRCTFRRIEKQRGFSIRHLRFSISKATTSLMTPPPCAASVSAPRLGLLTARTYLPLMAAVVTMACALLPGSAQAGPHSRRRPPSRSATASSPARPAAGRATRFDPTLCRRGTDRACTLDATTGLIPTYDSSVRLPRRERRQRLPPLRRLGDRDRRPRRRRGRSTSPARARRRRTSGAPRRAASSTRARRRRPTSSPRSPRRRTSSSWCCRSAATTSASRTSSPPASPPTPRAPAPATRRRQRTSTPRCRPRWPASARRSTRSAP